MPFKVQQLIERRRQLVTATPDETLQSALERMIEHSFSQLPVVDDENRPLGMVTSDSIVRALEMFGVTVDKPQDFRKAFDAAMASDLPAVIDVKTEFGLQAPLAWAPN